MIDFTCKGCEMRTPGCHDTCEVYKRERAALEKEKSQINLAKEFYRYSRSSAASNMDGIAKKRKRQQGYRNFANQK